MEIKRNSTGVRRMERLREFIQNHRNTVIVVGGLMAIAVTGCCLIGIYAITAEQPLQAAEPDPDHQWHHLRDDPLRPAVRPI
jgi:hypothetical protein